MFVKILSLAKFLAAALECVQATPPASHQTWAGVYVAQTAVVLVVHAELQASTVLTHCLATAVQELQE